MGLTVRAWFAMLNGDRPQSLQGLRPGHPGALKIAPLRRFRAPGGPRPAGRGLDWTSGVQVAQAQQGRDELLVVAPALHRALVDLLAHLPGAGRGYGTLELVELEAAVVPRQAEELQDPAGPFLRFGN